MEEDKKNEKEQERQRFVAYLGPKPDLTELAEKTGITRQVLYYITTGRNFVSGSIHKEMARTFPNYDLSWQMFGIRSDRPKAEEDPASGPVDEASLFRLQAKVARLETENEFLRKAADEASQEKAKYWKMLESLHEQNLDFSAVSSQTTGQLFSIDKPLAILAPGFNHFRVIGEKKIVSSKWTLPGVINLQDAIEE